MIRDKYTHKGKKQMVLLSYLRQQTSHFIVHVTFDVVHFKTVKSVRNSAHLKVTGWRWTEYSLVGAKYGIIGDFSQKMSGSNNEFLEFCFDF